MDIEFDLISISNMPTSSGKTSKPEQVVFNVSHRFKVERLLGTGTYGKVCFAVHKSTGTKVAIKKIEPFSNSLVSLKTLREIKLLAKFNNHENIVSLFELQEPESFASFNEVYLVQEYMPFDLLAVIDKRNLTDDHVQYFIYQILRGLKALHLANVIHRDLKPCNILVNNQCDIKICDLGLSRLSTQASTKDKLSPLTEYVATRWYRAPEIMLTPSNYSTAVDMWSAGCILAEMFTGLPLFPGRDFKSQLMLIFQLIGTPTPNSEHYKCIRSPRAKQYIKTLPFLQPLDFDHVFQFHPSRIKRYGSVMINPVGIDLLKMLLEFSPVKRYTVEQALLHPYLSIYHDNNDEPVSEPIDMEDFEFDRDNISMEDIKREMYEVICSFTRE